MVAILTTLPSIAGPRTIPDERTKWNEHHLRQNGVDCGAIVPHHYFPSALISAPLSFLHSLRSRSYSSSFHQCSSLVVNSGYFFLFHPSSSLWFQAFVNKVGFPSLRIRVTFPFDDIVRPSLSYLCIQPRSVQEREVATRFSLDRNSRWRNRTDGDPSAAPSPWTVAGRPTTERRVHGANRAMRWIWS